MVIKISDFAMHKFPIIFNNGKTENIVTLGKFSPENMTLILALKRS